VVEELADLLEVVRALAAEHGVDWDEVLTAADDKKQDRGGFAGRLFLTGVEESGQKRT